MIIGVSEGDRYRFEVLLMSDGFIVRVRTIGTGAVLTTRDRLFRTAPAAFAFAEMSALKDAEEAPLAGIEALEAKLASDRAAKVFEDIRTRLADGGVSGTLLAAWDKRAQAGSAAAKPH
ncbi:MAG: hypothetical protein LCH61_01520 [Proteobacteria bacterium]|nr:hypothetical protein [Pseudomonadota bacterium]